MRIFCAAAVMAMLFIPQIGHAQENPAPGAGVSATTAISPADQAIKSDAIAKAARDKAEAMERSRDRKMRAISKGICTGC